MTTQEMIELSERAISERRILVLDYHTVEGLQRWGRGVAPFDVGSRSTTARERNKDKLFAFSEAHTDTKSGQSAPMIVPIKTENISRAEMGDATFDPIECNAISMRTEAKLGHKPYNWLKIPDGFNIARDRGW